MWTRKHDKMLLLLFLLFHVTTTVMAGPHWDSFKRMMDRSLVTDAERQKYRDNGGLATNIPKIQVELESLDPSDTVEFTKHLQRLYTIEATSKVDHLHIFNAMNDDVRREFINQAGLACQWNPGGFFSGLELQIYSSLIKIVPGTNASHFVNHLVENATDLIACVDKVLPNGGSNEKRIAKAKFLRVIKDPFFSKLPMDFRWSVLDAIESQWMKSISIGEVDGVYGFKTESTGLLAVRANDSREDVKVFWHQLATNKDTLINNMLRQKCPILMNILNLFPSDFDYQSSCQYRDCSASWYGKRKYMKKPGVVVRIKCLQRAPQDGIQPV